ncbi:MAG: NAD(P)H-hydrate epimerase [Isosphaeraceae bacterium]
MTPEFTPPPISRAQARAFDAWAERTLGLPTLVLMENAGRGAADFLLELIGDGEEEEKDPTLSRVLVVCGFGNNGGDGAVVARRLLLRSVPVRVVWFGALERASRDASIQYEVLKALGVDQTVFADSFPSADFSRLLLEADWVVDALLGTGPTSPIREPLSTIIDLLNRSGKPIFSLDLPTGLDADLGAPLGISIIARATATFVAPKLGFSNPSSLPFTGPVRVIDIGLPAGAQGIDGL